MIRNRLISIIISCINNTKLMKSVGINIWLWYM